MTPEEIIIILQQPDHGLSRFEHAVFHSLVEIRNNQSQFKLQLHAIMSNQAELAADIRAANTQLQKISGESTRTLAKVTELEAIIAAGGEITPELKAAAVDLKATIQGLDDLTPDLTDGSGSTGETVNRTGRQQ